MIKMIQTIFCVMFVGAAFSNARADVPLVSNLLKLKKIKKIMKDPNFDKQYMDYYTGAKKFLYSGAKQFLKKRGPTASFERMSFDGQKIADDVDYFFKGVVNFYGYINGFIGSIPDNFFNLTTLENIGLSGNAFSGPLSERIGNLTRLEYLDLCGNKITGPIPKSIEKLSNLKKLNLSSNPIKGTIPESIGKLSNLERLDLFSNQFTGNIPQHIGNLTNLEHLDLSSNQLTGPIPDFIGDLVSLKDLNLSSNQLTDSLPLRMGDLENLEELNISHNQISGSFSLEKHVESPKKINLSNNFFTSMDLRSSEMKSPTGRTIIPKISIFNNPLREIVCEKGPQNFELVPDTNGTHIHIDTSALKDDQSTRRILNGFLKNPMNQFPLQIGFYTKSGSNIPDFLKNKGFIGDEILILDIAKFDKRDEELYRRIFVHDTRIKNPPNEKLKGFWEDMLTYVGGNDYNTSISLLRNFPGHEHMPESHYTDLQSSIRDPKKRSDLFGKYY